MIIFKYAGELARYIQQQKTAGKQIGFVPTMGALHNGHIALIDQSKKDTGVTVCSIFVNPTQFNNPSDYQLYPKTIEQDIVKLESAGCNVFFCRPLPKCTPRAQPTWNNTTLATWKLCLRENTARVIFRGFARL